MIVITRDTFLHDEHHRRLALDVCERLGLDHTHCTEIRMSEAGVFVDVLDPWPPQFIDGQVGMRTVAG